MVLNFLVISTESQQRTLVLQLFFFRQTILFCTMSKIKNVTICHKKNTKRKIFAIISKRSKFQKQWSVLFFSCVTNNVLSHSMTKSMTTKPNGTQTTLDKKNSTKTKSTDNSILAQQKNKKDETTNQSKMQMTNSNCIFSIVVFKLSLLQSKTQQTLKKSTPKVCKDRIYIFIKVLLFTRLSIKCKKKKSKILFWRI